MEKVCADLDIHDKIKSCRYRSASGTSGRSISHTLRMNCMKARLFTEQQKFEDMVRTFCMNPNGIVVNENTNGIVTVNGHSYEDPSKADREYKLCASWLQNIFQSRSKTVMDMVKVLHDCLICLVAAFLYSDLVI